MKGKNTTQSLPLSARMVEDKAAEKLKKRLSDMGLIVNADVGRGAKPPEKKGGKK
jgi:hypothetical protein